MEALASLIACAWLVGGLATLAVFAAGFRSPCRPLVARDWAVGLAAAALWPLVWAVLLALVLTAPGEDVGDP